MTADQIIARLNLSRHPEGGWYRETWRAANPGRPSGTCIYFLLAEGESSHWHRVDATEIWLYHAGAPLVLSLAADAKGPATDHLLTPE
ncbi:cupin domain-containing protein, partial [Cribrihabitans sp. XS_ASV171]